MEFADYLIDEMDAEAIERKAAKNFMEWYVYDEKPTFWDLHGQKEILDEELTKKVKNIAKGKVIKNIRLTDEQKKNIAIINHVTNKVVFANKNNTLSYNLLPLLYNKEFAKIFDLESYLESILEEIVSSIEEKVLDENEVNSLVTEITPYVEKSIVYTYNYLANNWKEYFKEVSEEEPEEVADNEKCVANVDRNINNLKSMSSVTANNVSRSFVKSKNDNIGFDCIYDDEKTRIAILNNMLLESKKYPFSNDDIVNFINNSKGSYAIFSEVPDDEFYKLVSKPEPTIRTVK